MAFEPYGGFIWSDEPAEPYHTVTQQALKLGVAAGIGAIGFYGFTRTLQDNTRLIDTVVAGSEFLSNLSPFQVLHTFRVSEFLSPFQSVVGQGLISSKEAAGLIEPGKFGFIWEKEYLQSKDTYDYLKIITGLSDEEMFKAGLTRGMRGGEHEIASKLVFERSAESSRGTLYTIVGDQKRKLSDSIQLMSLSERTSELLEPGRALNRAAQAIYQALDLYTKPGSRPEMIFRKVAEEGSDRVQGLAKYLPIPSITGAVNNIKDLALRTAYLRAYPAFEMHRFNRLLTTLVEQTVGPGGLKVLKHVTGMGPGVVPGPASSTFARFGVKAAGLMGAGLLMAELDWVRRNYDLPGQMIASGAVAATTGYVLSKMGKSPQTALLAASATFFGQMVLPGFDQGIIPGLATIYTRSHLLRANPINPFNYYRRTLEGFFPGVTDWKFAALLGIGVASFSAGGLKIPFTGKDVATLLLENFGPETFGMPSYVEIPVRNVRGEVTGTERVKMRPLRTKRDIFWSKVLERSRKHFTEEVYEGLSTSNIFKRAQLFGKLIGAEEYKGNFTGLLRHLNNIWAEAEEAYRIQQELNPFNRALIEKLTDLEVSYAGKTGIAAQISKQLKGLGIQYLYSFFGATPAVKEVAEEAAKLGFRTPLGRLGLLFGGTFAVHQVLTGGFLGSMETSEELRDLYSGRKLVKVRSGRWWEGGGTPFEGRVDKFYVRPHWYHMMMNRVRQKGIWGPKEDTIDPISKFIRANFTYELERQHYYDRPYPITAPAFSDIPIIGGILGSTIGRLIKPPRIMHPNEWIREGPDGNMQFASVYEGWRREPAYSLGAKGPGIPASPYAPEQQAYFLDYQFRELAGFTGWARSVLYDMITGEDMFGTDRPVLADSGMMTSPRIRFWESELGGAFFTSEAIRRILPRQRSDVERTNPIINSMPSWLPERFHYGDPYRLIPWGEARLPGAGYSALHPELHGIDPEDYPLVYRYAILSDVAPASKQYRKVKRLLYERRKAGLTTEMENEYIDYWDSLVREKFGPDKFDRAHGNAITLPGSGITQSLWFAAQQVVRSAVAPVEYLTPFGFRPVQKLMSNRDAIERYEFERLYGTAYSFWDKPIRDWFRPAVYSAMHFMGFEGKPIWREEADRTNEWFDKIEFYKWMRLAMEAEKRGDTKAKSLYLYLASGTRTGVNPQGNPMSIYWTLPANERSFFNAFAFAKGKDRERILEMVPADQRHLYTAVWNRLDQGDPGMFPGSATSIDQRYMLEQFYRLQDYFTYAPLPDEDWIGWHEDVDLEDIKVRYVDELGKDIYDFGLWESSLKKSMQQPFLAGSTAPLHAGGGIHRGGIYNEVYNILNNGTRPLHVSAHNSPTQFGYSHVNFYDDREQELLLTTRGIIGG